MVEELELTYQEHLAGVINSKKEEYTKALNEVIRNITLHNEDIEDGIITNHFFMRDDISVVKKDEVHLLNTRLYRDSILF